MLALFLVAQSVPMSIVFGGDIMLNGVSVSRLPLAGTGKIFRAADLGVANFEIPLTTATTRTVRKTAKEIRDRDQFVLKADPDHAKGVREAGIRLVSLANNHAMDYGPTGLAQFMVALRKTGFTMAGAGKNSAEAGQVAVVMVKGKRIGLVSALAFINRSALWKCGPATQTTPGINVLSFGGKVDPMKVARIVQNAKQRCDFLIVGLHWGLERKTLPSAYQVSLGRAFIRAGADVVWGHHPHVLQGAEIYQGKPILYSMGNLVSPISSETGLLRLTFGSKIGWTSYRAQIRSGRTTVSAGAGRLPALSAQFARAYPDPDSQNPFAR